MKVVDAVTAEDSVEEGGSEYGELNGSFESWLDTDGQTSETSYYIDSDRNISIVYENWTCYDLTATELSPNKINRPNLL